MSQIESPCIGVCKVAEDHCVGCGRSLLEIEHWVLLNPRERNRIMGELPARVRRLTGNATAVGGPGSGRGERAVGRGG